MAQPIGEPLTPFLMNDQIACTRGEHQWLPWIHPSPTIWRTICLECRMSCSYDQGEWKFSQRAVEDFDYDSWGEDA